MTNEAKNTGKRYRIDAGGGRFTVHAFAGGMLSFAGHNPSFAVRRYGGEIQFNADNSEVVSMLLIAQAESLSLLNKVSDKDRKEIEGTMRGEVLETAKFSEIVFVSKDVSMKEMSKGKYAVTANGILSIHGESLKKTVKAEAEINGESIGANGEIALDQSDFNIEQTKALGGTLKVKDEVKILFDIAAHI